MLYFCLAIILDNSYQTIYSFIKYLFGKKRSKKMGVIKSVLKEELENSLRMKEEYEKALKANPGGCIVRKEVKGDNLC